MPSVLESYTQIVELIARYVGRSVLAMPLEFIDKAVDSMICCDRGPEQRACRPRDGVARAGARLFEISSDRISMAKFTGNPEHANNMMDGV